MWHSTGSGNQLRLLPALGHLVSVTGGFSRELVRVEEFSGQLTIVDGQIQERILHSGEDRHRVFMPKSTTRAGVALSQKRRREEKNRTNQERQTCHHGVDRASGRSNFINAGL